MKSAMVIDLRKVMANEEAIGLLPAPLARRLRCLPLLADERTITVAVRDAADYSVIDQVHQHTGREVKPLAVNDIKALEAALLRYYPPDIDAGEGAPALFRRILHRAVQMRASDIHLDPTPQGGTVLLRIDGALRRERELSAGVFTEVVSAVKVMAGLDIAERRVPQDGQFEVESAGEHLSLRVATIPVIHGEKATLRLLFLAGDEALASLAVLGMDEHHFAIFSRALELADGILLLTGPTGSGKTTTLYAALRQLAASGEEHILSIEDPVEIPLPGVNQVRVRHEEGLTGFHVAIRSALRHDPDIIMIGEIRDAESADIAAKAAMSGHLVLSTLHTNDAVGVITRLENLGIPPYLVAATLRLAAAQRLVRIPCRHCVRRAPASPEHQRIFGISEDEEFITARGCHFCGNIGYAGRTGLFEMAPIDACLREMILARQGESALRQYLTEAGHPSLLADGLAKARRGITTLAEVARAVLMGV